jgi:hypothetical protein
MRRSVRDLEVHGLIGKPRDARCFVIRRVAEVPPLTVFVDVVLVA